MKLQLGTRGHMATPRASAGPVSAEVRRHQQGVTVDCQYQPRHFHVGALWAADCKYQGDNLSPRTESNPQRGEKEKSPELSRETESKPTSRKMKCFLSSAVTVVIYEQVFRYRKIDKIKFLSM